MRLPRVRFTVRWLMIAVAAVALVPMCWNVWSGRRERFLELADRHALHAAEFRRNILKLPYAPAHAAIHERDRRRCEQAANNPYEDFLTGRWSQWYWFTPP
jgi:hypothetical protein